MPEAETAPEVTVDTGMPRYKCHKEVGALKIAGIDTDYGNGGAMIVPDEEGFASFSVSQSFLNKFRPYVGGYYIVYADGYKSFSPPRAFEAGYSKL